MMNYVDEVERAIENLYEDRIDTYDRKIYCTGEDAPYWPED